MNFRFLFFNSFIIYEFFILSHMNFKQFCASALQPSHPSHLLITTQDWATVVYLQNPSGSEALGDNPKAPLRGQAPPTNPDDRGDHGLLNIQKMYIK